MADKSSRVFPVRKIGIQQNPFGDFYHSLMKMPWWQYFFFFFVAYLSINALFGAFYYFAGDSIINATGSYWDAFIFSFQTSSTIGYGQFLPKTAMANVVVIFDAISGILFVALSTGLAFAKFSRPTARVLFSENVLLTQFDGNKVLMFRLGNSRMSQIIDASINVVFSRQELTPEGIPIRKMYDLNLTRSHSPLFSLSWTVIHIIDENSPLHGYGEELLSMEDVSVIISLTGIDDVFSQTVYDRYIYRTTDFILNHKFVDLVDSDKDGMYMDYRKFHQLEDL